MIYLRCNILLVYVNLVNLHKSVFGTMGKWRVGRGRIDLFSFVWYIGRKNGRKENGKILIPSGPTPYLYS